MKETVLETDEIVVTASRMAQKKDQTSSIRNVSSEQIEVLPVESVQGVLQMQAGVVAGHFRGGRANEVAYMIDGLQVTEAFRGESRLIDVEPEAIQDLEVITGTFNAEYGRAMSGVVNAVTKEGGKHFEGMALVQLGNYLTGHKDVFIGMKDSELNRLQDYRLQLSGPIIGERVTFFTNFRHRYDKSYLNGIHRFNVDDSSNFQDPNPQNWYSEHTGDNDFVPLNDSKSINFLSKITARLTPHIKLTFSYIYNKNDWQEYNHFYKYNPYGLASYHKTSSLYTVGLNHLIGQSAFYELKFSYLDSYFGHYVFENPLDTRYVNEKYDLYGRTRGFSTGSQQKMHERRWLRDFNAKFDLTYQLTKHHSLKTGLLYTGHNLDNRYSEIRNKYYGTALQYVLYEPVIYPDSSIYSDIYKMKPVEFSAYIQDKIEFEELVINFGVRYDYFDPAAYYPSQRRNPANQLDFPNNPEKMSRLIKAKPKVQISPRLGLAYQLSDVALLHFSYGHFFQMPPLYALYENHAFRVAPKDYQTTMGNSQIKAQKTVQYEVGLWQEIVKGMGLEVALYYRDIYSLLSTKIISTYNQIQYGLYTNKDYGNSKGLEVKLDYTNGPVAAYLNYTLQYTRGNADNPRFNFDRAGNSRDPIPTLIPMSWDQRHTFNATVSYQPANYGVTLTGYFNSGLPYTWVPQPTEPLARLNLYPNFATRPSKIKLDMNAFYLLKLADRYKLKFTLNVYNLLDRLNENIVNPETGRACTAIIRPEERAAHRSNFNEVEDRYRNPGMYDPPRLVKFGIGIIF
ncbi:MAG: TonB-dependent receptor [Caldisericaceae bacterium]|nr:TonB-dependent receptor [Caldisericaceae bacterium]